MYLYLFEDGVSLQNSDAPTYVDLQCVADGTLTIVRNQFDGFYEILADGSEKRISATTTEGSPETGGLFHAPPKDH